MLVPSACVVVLWGCSVERSGIFRNGTWSRADFIFLFDLQGIHSALRLDVHGLFSLSPERYCMYGVSAVAVRGRVLV
jgi:hypothetical protein